MRFAQEVEKGVEMAIHLQKELENIKKKLLFMGTLVEDKVLKSVKSIYSSDYKAADEIVNSDSEVDSIEVAIEEECLKVLALHQPVAVDLRFLIAVIKINNELERIGDQAVNIANRVKKISTRKEKSLFYDYSFMGEKVLFMLNKSLDSFINHDIELAKKVISLDDQVDQIRNEVYDLIKEGIKKNPEQAGYLLNLLLISSHLERIADLSTNIAEEIIYLVDGEIIRHT